MAIKKYMTSLLSYILRECLPLSLRYLRTLYRLFKESVFWSKLAGCIYGTCSCGVLYEWLNLPFGVLCHIGTISATCARYFRWLYEHANSKTSVSSLYFHKKSLICFNQIHQKITLFFEILQSNSTVTSLDLTDTNLGADGARHIADLLRENHFITELVGTSVVTTLTFLRGICRFTNKNEAIQQFCPKISKQNTDTLHIRQNP